MQFNSITFILFFLIVLLVFQLLPSWRSQKAWLFITSLLFYAAWNPPFVLLLLLSIIVDWYLASKMFLSENKKGRQILLFLSLLVNLGVLGFFKYGNFALAQFTLITSSLGVHYQPPKLDIVLPVGISFYTFQTLSYTIDVYRKRITKPPSFLDFSVYVSFFPQLVAGPIVRADHFLPQLEKPRRIEKNSLGYGLALLIFGLFQKCVLADAIFAPVADSVFTFPAMQDSFSAWLGVLSFSGQIFYDFSGYTLCAIGAALCMGFQIPDNFRFPYAASGFSDFWRRWHLSLSSWLRDYLYISLGGNRNGSWATYRNLMLTMLIGGLWHGASWMFVIWGGLHGLYLCIERFFSRFQWHLKVPLVVKTLLTFIVVSLTWIPFRAANLTEAQTILVRLFKAPPIMRGKSLHELFPTAMIDPLLVVVSVVAIIATLVWHFTQRNVTAEARFNRWTTSRIAFYLIIALLALFLVSGGDEHAFIYFQF
jgi:alginate O-acetyltransferase complex protein AlgI